MEYVRRLLSLPFADDAGVPFLALFARSGDFDEDTPLRWRLPFEPGLRDFFLIAIGGLHLRHNCVWYREQGGLGYKIMSRIGS